MFLQPFTWRVLNFIIMLLMFVIIVVINNYCAWMKVVPFHMFPICVVKLKETTQRSTKKAMEVVPACSPDHNQERVEWNPLDQHLLSWIEPSVAGFFSFSPTKAFFGFRFANSLLCLLVSQGLGPQRFSSGACPLRSQPCPHLGKNPVVMLLPPASCRVPPGSFSFLAFLFHISLVLLSNRLSWFPIVINIQPCR